MKAQINTQIITLFFLIVGTIGCDSFKTSCDEIEENNLTMLIDISDEKLYKEIEADITSNFPAFMNDAPFGKIEECEVFKMTIGNFSGVDELHISESQIGITKRGLSATDKRRLSNSRPLINLLYTSLEKFNEQSKNTKYNNATNLTQTIVKAIVGMSEEAQNTLLISSDMIINNKTEKINFYKNIPKDAGATLRNIIDPELLDKFKTKVDSGIELKVIIIHKNEPKKKVNKKEVKAFWVKCFEELEIEDIQFIDNLTNKILWD